MRELAIWGLGELGRWLGGAALKAGLRVTPITRDSQPEGRLAQLHPDTPLLIAVGEAALDGVLAAVPSARQEAVILLQNELFPSVWQRHDLSPTVMVPWFLKKRGEPEQVGRATRVFGRHAALVEELHAVLKLPCERVQDPPALRQALVDKYAFILTINALGLTRDATLGSLRSEQPERAQAVAAEAVRLGAALCADPAIDEQASVQATFEAMEALSNIRARGRTAGERVARALDKARVLGLVLPELSRIEREAAP